MTAHIYHPFYSQRKLLTTIVISASTKSSDEVNAVTSAGPASGSSVYEYATQNKQMRHDELFRLYLVFQEMRIAGVQVRHAMQCNAVHVAMCMT